jgi:DNA-binding winged helix-turn-helix (wHTH) protein
LAVLRYLAERPGQLIPGEELLKRLWPGTYVTKTVLRVCVRELRQALGEDPVVPRFIETVGREGYRFIGAVQRLESRVQSLEEEREHQEARSPSFPVSSLKPLPSSAAPRN